jgi:hypothetical protein
MSGLSVVLSILIAVLSLTLAVNHDPRKGLGGRLAKHRNTFAVTNCIAVVLLLMANSRESGQLRRRAEGQRRTLEAKIDGLSAQNRGLMDRNQAFADHLADCNARAEALTKKAHASAQLTRDIGEVVSAKDSLTGKRNK